MAFSILALVLALDPYQARQLENHYIIFDLIFGVLTPLSTIFQLYHGDQF